METPNLPNITPEFLSQGWPGGTAPKMLSQRGITEPGQWAILRTQIFPNAKRVQSIIFALDYCNARGLDVFKRHVHIVPMSKKTDKKHKDGKWVYAEIETVLPSIDAARTDAHGTGLYAGLDPVQWGDEIERVFTAKTTMKAPEYAEVTVYRMVGGQRMPFTARCYFNEFVATTSWGDPNPIWKSKPHTMLAKCAEAAALRAAFPESSIDATAEEMTGQVVTGDIQDAGEYGMSGVIIKPGSEKKPETDDQESAQREIDAEHKAVTDRIVSDSRIDPTAVELSPAGHIYNPAIHSPGKTLKNDGTWRLRTGLSKLGIAEQDVLDKTYLLLDDLTVITLAAYEAADPKPVLYDQDQVALGQAGKQEEAPKPEPKQEDAAPVESAESAGNDEETEEFGSFE